MDGKNRNPVITPSSIYLKKKGGESKMENSKQPYMAPEVTKHGTVQELTQNVGATIATDVPLGTPASPHDFGSNI